METLQRYVKEANRAYELADHMTHTTYTVVKDPKLLLLAATHLHTAVNKAIQALIYYDYLFKRISYVPKDSGSMMDMFKRVSIPRYSIPRDVVPAVMEIQSIVRDHKMSEMEFRRKNQFIIASKNYRLRTLTIEKLKNFLKLTKPLLQEVNEIQKQVDRRIA